MRTPSLLYARLYTAPSDPAHRQHQHQHHQQQQQREPEHEHAHHDHLFGGKLDDLHTPFPKDVPPISQRLRPLVPFLIVWTIITSLAVHLLRVRTEGEQSTARAHAQESVLEGLVQRFQAGEVVDDTEIRRELEMVGLRERTSLTLGVDADLAEMREVSWWEVLRGRKRDGEDEEGGDGKKEEDMSDEEKETAAAKEWSKSECGSRVVWTL